MWLCLGMLLVCLLCADFPGRTEELGGCCLVVEQSLCPPARRVDLLINSRVRPSAGSQECSGTFRAGLSFSLFMAIRTGLDNHSLFGC